MSSLFLEIPVRTRFIYKGLHTYNGEKNDQQKYIFVYFYYNTYNNYVDLNMKQLLGEFYAYTYFLKAK